MKRAKLVPGISTSFSTNIAAPPLNSKTVGYWLLGTGGLVGCMVSVGGLTRLTKSGLSMTDWKVQGSLPPSSQQDWEAEFNRYKTFPEWQQRKSMSLEEFKFIYYWEWGHRMLGRALGVVYIAPLTYFALRRQIPPALYGKLAALLGLGATQGLIGWWMVRSGLEDVDSTQRKEIRVSPYRLATHLGMAFTTGTLLLWTGFEALSSTDRQKQAELLRRLATGDVKQLLRVHRLGVASLSLIGITALSGAFVAGNSAGCAFNTWPKMGDEWVPSEVWSMPLQPAWRNFFETTATVQFDHRMLAYTSAATVALTFAAARRPSVWALLPLSAQTSLNAMAAMVGVQISLGIATLLTYVPIELAATHQAGSLALLAFGTRFVHSMKIVQRLTQK